MPERDVAVWIIRAAPQSRLAKAFVDNGVVALGWPDLIGDLTGLDAAEIADELARSPRIATPMLDAAELVAFRDDVDEGDLVVTPDAAVREFVVGRIAGPYEHRPHPPTVDKDGPYRHIRRVDWWGRESRDELPEHLAKVLSWRRTIRRLDNEEEWLAVGEDLRDAPRAATARGRSKSGGGGSRSTVRPAVAATRRCESCQQARPASQFARGSSLCNDCRADL